MVYFFPSERNSYTGPTQVASIPVTFKATIVLCRISLLNPNNFLVFRLAKNTPFIPPG